jgi:aryl sulfotransferase
MPTLLRPATREYRAFAYDSRRWANYKPRDNDIVIATYPKCGTTWTQRLVSMLVFRSAAPCALSEVSPWIDRRFGPGAEETLAKLEAQTHRRFIKSHLPLDALPIYDTVKYIHVARDGRDACMSFHNHSSSFTPGALEDMDRIGLGDETIGRPYPRVTAAFRPFYFDWINEAPWETTLCPLSQTNFFDFETTFWSERRRENVLLVHYNDLKQDLEGELRRLAAFLDIDIAEELWPQFAAAGSFEAMRRDGDDLMPEAARAWKGGAKTFLNKGTNGRWRDLLTPEDIALYTDKAKRELPPACAQWLEHGRLATADPRTT